MGAFGRSKLNTLIEMMIEIRWMWQEESRLAGICSRLLFVELHVLRMSRLEKDLVCVFQYLDVHRLVAPQTLNRSFIHV